MVRLRFRPKRSALLFNPLKKAIGDFDIDIAISTAIVSVGPASAYALVWEYGNLRQTKKGPKTTLGIDPETGARVWLTIQAPSGYVRIWKPRFKTIIASSLHGIKWGERDAKHQLTDAVERMGERMANLVETTAPVDKGDLKASITWLKPRQAKQLTRALRGVRGSG